MPKHCANNFTPARGHCSDEQNQDPGILHRDSSPASPGHTLPRTRQIRDGRNRSQTLAVWAGLPDRTSVSLTQRPVRPWRHSAKSTLLATLFQITVQSSTTDTQLACSRTDIPLATVQHLQRMGNILLPETSCRL